MIIKENIIKVIIESEETMLDIAKATDVKFRTVERWLRENHFLLTTAASLNVIRKFTGLTDSEILEDSKITA